MTDHKYADWELFGGFVCKAVEDGLSEIESFVRHWNHGDWNILERDWPEWVEYVECQLND